MPKSTFAKGRNLNLSIRMKKVLLLVAGDNGTIGSCSLHLYEALKSHKDVKVKCAIVHHFENGYPGFADAEFFDKFHRGGFKEQRKWLQEIKKDFRPDITISTLFSVNTLNILSGGKDKKIGIFHSPHQQVRGRGLRSYIMTLLQYMFIYPRFDKLCCVSKEVYKSLSTFPTISSRKKEVVYNVHNLDRIKALSLEDTLEEAERMIFRNPTIIYCGRLDSNKAPDRALKAFAKANIPENSQLVFLGEDQENMEAQLIKCVEKLGINGRVRFLGRKSNPYPYFRASKLLISSSYSEGLPGVIIEALALGKPVVTTNSSMGIWEIFSCLDDYNQRLTGIYETPCGVISSNLSHLDKAESMTDILNLSRGIEIVFNKQEVTEFEFEKQVTGQTIVRQLLSNL